jgi:hypothetical protein
MLVLAAALCCRAGIAASPQPAPATHEAQRVMVGTLTKHHDGSWGPEDMFAYIDWKDITGLFYSSSDYLYYNVFRMGDGRTIAVCLRACQERGMFTRDMLGVYDLTDRSGIYGKHFEIGKDCTDALEGAGALSIRFTPQGSDTLVTVTDQSGASAVLSLNLMYRLRVLNEKAQLVPVGGDLFYVIGESAGFSQLLWFEEEAFDAALDPGAAPSRLVPKYVVPTGVKQGVVVNDLGDELPLGDSGWVLRKENGRWTPHKAE